MDIAKTTYGHGISAYCFVVLFSVDSLKETSNRTVSKARDPIDLEENRPVTDRSLDPATHVSVARFHSGVFKKV